MFMKSDSTMADLNEGGLSLSEIIMTEYRFLLIENGVMVVIELVFLSHAYFML